MLCGIEVRILVCCCRAPGIPGSPMEDGGSRCERGGDDEDRSPAVTGKEPQSIHGASPWLGVLACFALVALGGLVFVFVADIPPWLIKLLVPTLMGILILLGVCVWCILSNRVWKPSFDCCSQCDLMDVAPHEDPLDAVKLCCCAISCTGPAVIMGGSIILLWVLKAYTAAATLSCLLMSLITVVAYLDVKAAIHCLECLRFQCNRAEGCSALILVKSFIALASSLGFWRLLLILSLSTCFNVGSAVMGWVILGSFNALWSSGFGYVPVGLIIFITPLLAIGFCLNIVVLLSCSSALARCLRSMWPDKGTKSPWTASVYDVDTDETSFTESEGIQVTPPIHVVIS